MADYNKKNGPVQMVTRAVNKKGELKGKNKKETKALKAICPHHRYNKKGKLKPTFFMNQDGTCICTMCGARFRTNFYNNDEIGQIVGDMKSVNEQAKFISVAAGLGEKTTEYFSQFGGLLSKYKKTYKKARNIASKQDQISNKKKKKNRTGSSQYGSWGRN